MAFTPFLNETEAQGGVACRQVQLFTSCASLCDCALRTLAQDVSRGHVGWEACGGWSRAEAGRPFSASSPLLSPQVHLAEAVLWEESGRVAGIFAQCQSQQFPGSLCNIGGDSPDSGTSNRYKASPV